MSGQSAPQPGPETQAPAHLPARPEAGSHRLVRHDDPMCACGQPREACLADVVREIWALSPSV